MSISILETRYQNPASDMDDGVEEKSERINSFGASTLGGKTVIFGERFVLFLVLSLAQTARSMKLNLGLCVAASVSVSNSALSPGLHFFLPFANAINNILHLTAAIPVISANIYGSMLYSVPS